MWKDEIVEETRRIREAHAALFNYDLDAIYRDLKNKEQKSGRKFVSFPPKQPITILLTKSSKKSGEK